MLRITELIWWLNCEWFLCRVRRQLQRTFLRICGTITWTGQPSPKQEPGSLCLHQSTLLMCTREAAVLFRRNAMPWRQLQLESCPSHCKLLWTAMAELRGRSTGTTASPLVSSFSLSRSLPVCVTMVFVCVCLPACILALLTPQSSHRNFCCFAICRCCGKWDIQFADVQCKRGENTFSSLFGILERLDKQQNLPVKRLINYKTKLVLCDHNQTSWWHCGLGLQGEVTSAVVLAGYDPESSMTLEAFRILGLPSQPANVTINHKPVDFHYDTEKKVSYHPRKMCTFVTKISA